MEQRKYLLNEMHNISGILQMNSVAQNVSDAQSFVDYILQVEPAIPSIFF